MKQYVKQLYLIVASMLILLLAGCGKESLIEHSSEPSETMNAEQTTKAPQSESTADSVLEVHFLDVGQGDSILLRIDGETMLIDAGDNAYGDGVVSYLESVGVTKVDYLVGTHPDADHIGGLDCVINSLEIGTIYMPKQQSNTKTFEDVLTAISNKGLKINSPEAGSSFSFGGATVTVLGPLREYESNNDNSIVLKVTYGENSFLFMGDAELEAEEEIVDSGAELSADVLKVGHHGSSSSTSQALLQAVAPTYAVISCGEDNKYGHPHTETMTYLKNANVTVYRTDEQNTIIMTSDGSEISIQTDAPSIASTSSEASTTEPTEKIEKTQEPQATDVATTEETYIGNKNSKKYHRTTCSSLPAKKNQVVFSSKEEAEAAGYEACQNCNP